jgi:hypothetical protein
LIKKRTKIDFLYLILLQKLCTHQLIGTGKRLAALVMFTNFVVSSLERKIDKIDKEKNPAAANYHCKTHRISKAKMLT